ncbi:Gp19/Gp15/Gp42 family protein [Pseudonocardia sp. DLS-67]
MAIATPDDVAERLGRELDSTETVLVAARLADAEELIFQRIPDLAEKNAAGTIRQRLVVMVETEAVLRLVRNPEGYTSETDGNYSYSILNRVASGRLEIRSEEWAMLGVRSSIGLYAPKICLTYRPWWVVWDPSKQSDLDTAVWG